MTGGGVSATGGGLECEITGDESDGESPAVWVAWSASDSNWAERWVKISLMSENSRGTGGRPLAGGSISLCVGEHGKGVLLLRRSFLATALSSSESR